MSIETDVRGLLAGYSGLTALVGPRIAQDAVPDESAYPLVVYAVRRDRLTALDGTALLDQCSVAVQCWAETGVAAAAVADQVVAALGTAPLANAAIVIDRSTTFDPDMGLDGVLLTVQWWG